MNFKKDNIYQHTNEIIDFSFDKKVSQVFPDMIHRSIPGYATLLTVVQAVFSREFTNSKNILIYDLGCSVGGITLALANVLPINSNFIGVDISKDMLVQYKKAIGRANLSNRVTPICKDITELNLIPCQIIALNFTLQFLKPIERLSVIKKCYSALSDNGILFIAEKTISNKDISNWHEQFKRNNGYSDLEIAKKRLAIENIMQIDSEKDIISRCHLSGFSKISQVFHALGFKAWVIKK